MRLNQHHPGYTDVIQMHVFCLFYNVEYIEYVVLLMCSVCPHRSNWPFNTFLTVLAFQIDMFQNYFTWSIIKHSQYTRHLRRTETHTDAALSQIQHTSLIAALRLCARDGNGSNDLINTFNFFFLFNKLLTLLTTRPSFSCGAAVCKAAAE